MKPQKQGLVLPTALILVVLLVAAGCVEQIAFNVNNNLNAIIVEGRLTTADEPQTLKLFRAKTDALSGLVSLPLTGATVQLLVDGSETVIYTEDKNRPGYYALPEHFRGQTGKTYQLKFRLTDGADYASEPEKLEAVAPMKNVNATFNPAAEAINGIGFNGFHELYVDTQDPADQRNFYSWEWVLYEKQEWCKSCVRGVYAVNKILPGVYLEQRYFVSGNEPFEDCFSPQSNWNSDWRMPPVPTTEWTYDYQCRTQCWQLFYSPTLNLFEDRLTNGGQILQRKVAKIPYYQYQGALVELRQLSHTKDAYAYFRLFQQQTENNGGITDTPPTALRGNISNVRDKKETVVGYFAVSDVSIIRYWLDRRDTGNAVPPGLFNALMARAPSPEPSPSGGGPGGAAKILISGGPPRVPTALCIRSDSRTPEKPLGWVDNP